MWGAEMGANECGVVIGHLVGRCFLLSLGNDGFLFSWGLNKTVFTETMVGYS